MSKYDREARLQLGADVLVALKNCGVSQTLVAAYLRVGHATVARWKRGTEDPTRKEGVPSEEHLTRMMELLDLQISANLREALECYRENRTRAAGAYLWWMLGATLEKARKEYDEEKHRREELTASMQKLMAALRAAQEKGLVQREVADSIRESSGLMSDGMREAHAIADDEAEAEVAASRVTREDAMRKRQERDEWLANYRKQQLLDLRKRTR